MSNPRDAEPTPESSWGHGGRGAARRLVQIAIDRGTRPGDKIESEPEMIEMLGVSRGTVRESLRLLSFVGATESRFGPGGGTYAAFPGAGAVASSLAMSLQSRRSTVLDVVEALGLTLPGVVGLAAVRATPADLVAFGSTIEAVRSSVGGDDFSTALWQWVGTVTAGAHNATARFQVAAVTMILEATGVTVTADWHDKISSTCHDVVAALTTRDRPASASSAVALTTALHSAIEADRAVADRWVVWPQVDARAEALQRREQEKVR